MLNSFFSTHISYEYEPELKYLHIRHLTFNMLSNVSNLLCHNRSLQLIENHYMEL